MNLKGKFTHIFFDADDTLWENEQFFRDAEAQFAELLSDYTSPEGVQELLVRNMEAAMKMKVKLAAELNTGYSWYDLK